MGILTGNKAASLRKITFWLLPFAAVGTLALFGTLVLQAIDGRICEFHFSDDRLILLRYDKWDMAERQHTLLYEVYAGSRCVSPSFRCGGIPIPFQTTLSEFRAFELPNGKLLIQQQSPDFPDEPWRTIIIYDSKRGKSVPRDHPVPPDHIDLSDARTIGPVPPAKRFIW